MLSNTVNDHILSCSSICGAVQQVHQLFAVQYVNRIQRCGFRTKLLWTAPSPPQSVENQGVAKYESDILMFIKKVDEPSLEVLGQQIEFGN